MTVKATFFLNAVVEANSVNGTSINAAGTTRVGSQSESWYSPLELASNVLFNACRQYQRLRAKLLPSVCSMSGFRLEEVGQPNVSFVGRSIPYDYVEPGLAATIQDIPQMALSYRVYSATTPAKRKFVMGMVPDARVLRGSFVPSVDWLRNSSELFQHIQDNFQMQAVDQTVTRYPIVSIDEDGNVITGAPTTFGAEDIIQVMRSDKNEDRQVGGYYEIETFTNATTFKLAKWDHGECTGGKIRLHRFVWTGVRIDGRDRVNPQATTKKVGRPLNAFRGRASAKR